MINPNHKKSTKAEKKTATTVSSRSVRWRAVFIIASAVILVALALLAGYAFYVSTRILPHTEIAGVKVGGLTKDQAKDKLVAKETDFSKKELTLLYHDKTWHIQAADLDPQFDNQLALDQAYSRGKDGVMQNEIKTFFVSLVKTSKFQTDLKDISEKGQKALADKALKDIETPVSETTLDFSADEVTINPGKAGEKLEYPVFHDSLYSAFVIGNSAVPLTLSSFKPEVSEAQAEPARKLAEDILTSDWKLKDGTAIMPIKTSDIANWLGTEVEKVDGAVTGLKLTLKSDDLKTRITAFAKANDRKPVNALLKEDKGKIVVSQPEKEGSTLQIDGSVKLVVDSLLANTENHTIPAQVKTAQADLRTDTVASLGITQLIGSASTNYYGSSSNRIHNIVVGQQTLNGGLVKNGEEYSTTKTLGPVDASQGYVQELVILTNRTASEYGGGLCQVSTTFFRAVLNAGLLVTDRTNHSYRVGYYERGIGPGLDATVYIPNPDFRWKNDTGHAVYIQAYVVGTTITFELYGTSDGRVASIDGPHTTETIPVGDPLYSDTDTLFVGQTKRLESAHDGARTTATYTVMRDGKQINQQIFNSYYKPWPAQYLRGTKPRPQE